MGLEGQSPEIKQSPAAREASLARTRTAIRYLIEEGVPLIREEAVGIFVDTGLQYESTQVVFKVLKELAPNRDVYRNHRIFYNEKFKPHPDSFIDAHRRIDEAILNHQKEGKSSLQVKVRDVDGIPRVFMRSEVKILELLRDGYPSSHSVLAELLGISRKTVANRISGLYVKLGIGGTGQTSRLNRALVEAFRLDLVKPYEPKINDINTSIGQLGLKSGSKKI